MCIFTIKRLILLCACISILSGNCALSGGSQEVLDHAWRVGSERPPRTAVESLTLLRTLLYPPSSPLAFVPAVFHFPYSSTSRANATLAMRNCTIWTLCPTLSAYAMAFPNGLPWHRNFHHGGRFGKHGMLGCGGGCKCTGHDECHYAYQGSSCTSLIMHEMKFRPHEGRHGRRHAYCCGWG